MKGVKVLKGNPQDLNRREASNARMKEASGNYVRRIMAGGKAVYQRAKMNKEAGRLREVRKPQVIRLTDEPRAVGWLRSFFNKLFRRGC